MTQPAKAQEPSMEEILASIRRIIADDDASKSALRAPAPPRVEAPPPSTPVQVQPAYSPPPVASFEEQSHVATETSITSPDDAIEDESSDILDLTESMATPMPQPASATSAVANSANANPAAADPAFADPAPASMPQPAAQFRTIDGNSDIDFDDAVEQPATPLPINDDEHGRLVSRETSAAVDSAFNALAQTVLVQNARTLEDLVREMLRPMLKTWLDDNLPGTVERLVRAEIERVSRGRAS